MKRFIKIAVRALAVWLALSAILSACATYAPTLEARYNIISNRCGLLIVVPHQLWYVDEYNCSVDYLGDIFSYREYEHCVTIYNPFSLACDDVIASIKYN